MSNKTYKIALVSDWYYPSVGGIEYAMNALARHLLAIGHTVHVIARSAGKTNQIEQHDGITIIRVAGGIYGNFVLSPTRLHALANIIRADTYDVVHAHGIDSPLGLMALLVAKRNKIPAIITNHSPLGSDLLRLAKIILLKIYVRNADAVIAVNHGIAQETKIFFKGKIFQVHNGFDQHSPNGLCQSYNLANNKIIITTVARMVKRKALHDFIEMARLLLQSRSNLFFVLAGDGPLRKNLEKLVAQYHLSQHFLFTGNISRASVLGLLEKTHIFVLPSQHEAFGIVVLEAFEKKVPVILRRGTGAANLVQHKKTGMLANNYQEFAECVIELINNSSLAQTIKTAAYHELRHYEWHPIAQQIANIYTRVIHEKKRHHFS